MNIWLDSTSWSLWIELIVKGIIYLFISWNDFEESIIPKGSGSILSFHIRDNDI